MSPEGRGGYQREGASRGTGRRQDGVLSLYEISNPRVLADTTARRMIPPDTTCAPGTGTFMLIPRRLIDHDLDGSMAVVFDPVMTSGTGEMTGAAWVRSARMVNGGALGMRIIKTNRNFVVTGTDQLLDPDVVSRPVTGTTSYFLPGVVSGVPALFMPDTTATQSINPVVTMTWECSNPLPQDQFMAIAGFSFDLGDLGCDSQWTQRWTVRPEPTLAPSRLVIEPYGNASNHRSIWLTPSPNGGWSFNQKLGRLLVKGKVNSVDVNQGMSVTITKAKYAGASVCTPGTHVLPPEE